MSKEPPASPIKTKASAFLHKLKRNKSGSLNHGQSGDGGGGREGKGAARSTAGLYRNKDGEVVVDISRDSIEGGKDKLEPKEEAGASSPSESDLYALSGISISTSPFLPSTSAFASKPASSPKPDASLRIETAPSTPVSAADISLPLPSPSEEETLALTDVVELQAFVEKKRWIEEQIAVLRALEPVDCFADCRPTFEGESGLTTRDRTLPSKEALQDMLKEHERIEAEAEKLDGGDIARLRQMAKAASQKSLSREDTDLLDITLSTLFLLDTLLHLLRDRADTLDLLTLRLDWDSRRWSIATDVEAIKSDVRAFVETKGSWSPDAYKQPTDSSLVGQEVEVNGLRTKLARRGSDASVKSMSSARSFGLGGSTASRSQRFLMTQIMELDCQSFQNRISTLRGGQVAHAARVLDRMIDVAASIRSRNKKRAAHESQASDDQAAPVQVPAQPAGSPEAEEEGALPDWFLDEMDRVELVADRLRVWDDFARAHARQWKLADDIYHTCRKSQTQADSLVSDITQAFLQHPSLDRAERFDSKASSLSSALAVLAVDSDPRLQIDATLHEAIDQSSTGRSSVSVILSEELVSATASTARATQKALGYRELAERTTRLDDLRREMGGLACSLEESSGQLKHGFSDDPTGDVLDLSVASCIHSTAHSVYLARLPDLLSGVFTSDKRSAAVLSETSALLMALKKSGMDPNFRSSVQATASRLQDARVTTSTLATAAASSFETLTKYRRIHAAQSDAYPRAISLRSELVSALDMEKWSELRVARGGASLDEWQVRYSALIDFVTSEATRPFSALNNSMRQCHPDVFFHLNSASTRLQSILGALQELSTRLHPALKAQREAMDRLQTRSDEIRRDCKELRASLKGTSLSFEVDARKLQDRIETLLSTLAEDISFVSSPSLAAALDFDGIPPLSPNSHAPLTPPRSPVDLIASRPSVLGTSPSARLELAILDEDVRRHANKLAASVASERALLCEAVRGLPLRTFHSQVEKVDLALSKVMDSVDAAHTPPPSATATPTFPVAASHQLLQEDLNALTATFEDLNRLSSSLGDDPSVQLELKRVQQTMEEMNDMATAILHPSRQRSRANSVASSIASDSGLPEDDTDRMSLTSSRRASSVRRPSTALPGEPAASTVTLPRSVSRNANPIISTPTKGPSLGKTARPRLPSSMLNLPSIPSPRSVSGPASSPGFHSHLPRYTLDMPQASPSRAVRQRTTSATSSSSHLATPIRAGQHSRLTSPSVMSPPPGSSFSTLPRASRYRSPAPGVLDVSNGETPNQLPNRRVSGELTQSRKRVVSTSALDDEGFATPTRRVVSGAARSTVSRRPYVPKKDHKLDRAVGKIVNSFPMEISIVPDREDIGTETGRYWIGEPPKLCYCRILRSRTVMVRVGGGWVELSKFLRDHFKDMIPSTSSPSALLSPALYQGERWISSGGGSVVSTGLSTPSRPPKSRSVSSTSLSSIVDNSPVKPHGQGPDSRPAPSTPDAVASDRRARNASGTHQPFTPTFTTPKSMTVLVSSPSDGLPGHPGSPGSPLVPLQLMRKADERERTSTGGAPAGPSSLSKGSLGLGNGTPSGRTVSSSSTRTVSGGRPSIPWRF